MQPAHNRMDFSLSFGDFKDPRLTFSVSSRRIHPDIDILQYLKVFFTYIDLRQITSVFGSTTRLSRLYGGRLAPAEYQLTEEQLTCLDEHGLHLALTLTNHFFDQSAYRESWQLLEEHHKPGNSIICTNDQLAACLRKDFPLYVLKASILKNLNTPEKVRRALALYDDLTLPMDKNDDDDFLDHLPEKNRIILFGNANCAYTCPARTCYLGFSQEIFGKPVTSKCSKELLPRLDMGHVYFDVHKLADMGFTHFKLVPLAPSGAVDVSRALSRQKKHPLRLIEARKPVYYLYSHPKCGRTWLRFILANYLQAYYTLDMQVDLHSYFSLLPNAVHDTLKGLEAYRFSADRRFPLLLSSHEDLAGQPFPDPRLSRSIFLLRSIPDVLVSMYFHWSRYDQYFRGSLQEFLHTPGSALEGYCRYLNAWASLAQTGKPLTLTYERMHQDTHRAVAGVLAFLNIPVDPRMLEQAVQRSSFDVMQALEQQTGMPYHAAPVGDPEALRMRKGAVGGSAAYLDRADQDHIRATAESLLTDATRALLREYCLWE